MANPILSIIIPLYNREEIVKDTIDSLLAQTNPNWEGIIVDDGSTDDSYKVAEEYTLRDPRIRLFKRPADRQKGPSSCRNTGFEFANGAIIFYLDSDDLLEPHFCEKSIEQFERSPDVDFIGVQCIYFSGNINTIPQEPIPLIPHQTEIRTHFLKESLLIQTETFCWRKRFLDRFPRHWPEDQSVGEDRVCYYRMITTPCKGAWEEEQIQVYHRTGSINRGKLDQLTPRVNRDPLFAAERALTVQRITETFRRTGNLDPQSAGLLLLNGLYSLRGVLSYNHKEPAKQIFQATISLAEEFERNDIIRKAYLYLYLKPLFRFHRIPLVEKSCLFFRKFLNKRKNLKK